MTMQEKPTLTIVAGREGPTEGPSSNAAKIAAVKAKIPANPRKGKRRGPYRLKAETVQKTPEGECDLTEERFSAYSDLEPHICDVVNMGRIAVELWDGPNRELYDFAVHEVWEMLEDLRKLYYAKGFAK
jgi:hypothetical protein